MISLTIWDLHILFILNIVFRERARAIFEVGYFDKSNQVIAFLSGIVARNSSVANTVYTIIHAHYFYALCFCYNISYHIEAETKWPTFLQMAFQNMF